MTELAIHDEAPVRFAAHSLKSSVQPPRSNGIANKVDVADQAAHNWYRFVLSYPPHLVRDYLHRFDATPSSTCLDPFCGTGTTPVECKKLGIPSIGIESHPMSYLAGKIKTDWLVDGEGLLEHASTIADRANLLLQEEGITDAGPNRKVRKADLLSLPEEATSLLLKNSISPLPLHKTLVLLGQLQRTSGSPYHGHELLALAQALVTVIGNLHFGPEVGVGPAKSDAPVVSAWLNNVARMAQDIAVLEKRWHVPATILRGDSRSLLGLIPANSIDAVITSPPYPNEKDYTRTTRLESVLLGILQTKADLQAVKRGLMRSNTRNVYKGDDDDSWVANNRDVQHIADLIEKRRIALNKTSGFEKMYARVTKLYFGGMARHFHELKTVLKPGAHLAYVVGDQASYLRVMIRTGQLLADIAEAEGYEVLGIDLFRTRLSTVTGENLREEAVVIKWKG
jgi:DNA modification methylase